MIGVEFRLRLSSLYSIRVPYSYQCARTYPLPAPSTLKGLCANALWRMTGENPNALLERIHSDSVGATSRANCPVVVSACMVRMVPQDALLRQFAFTPLIECLLVLRDEAEGLIPDMKEALRSSPVHLGDSESLSSIVPGSVSVRSLAEQEVSKGDKVKINSTTRVDLIKADAIKTAGGNKGTVLYMQDDPISEEAVLERYLAPLHQIGDTYHPIDGFEFEVERDCLLVKGSRLVGLFRKPEDRPSGALSKAKRKGKRGKS